MLGIHEIDVIFGVGLRTASGSLTIMSALLLVTRMENATANEVK